MRYTAPIAPGMDGFLACSFGCCVCLTRARAACRRRRRRDRRPRCRRAEPAWSTASNVALVTYSAHGVKRHVLYWGAVDWAAKFQPRLLGRLEEQGRRLQALQQQLQALHRAGAAVQIAACDAPDGSHWALQQWSAPVAELRRRQRRQPSSTSRTGAGNVGELADPDRLQLPRQAPAPLGQVHVPRQARLRHEVDDQGRAHRQAGPQHLRRLPQGPRCGAASTAS